MRALVVGAADDLNYSIDLWECEDAASWPWRGLRDQPLAVRPGFVHAQEPAPARGG
jgi:hypothetical protein